MHRLAFFALIGFGLGLTSQAKADIPPPLPVAKDPVTVKIEVDETATGPRLVIPNGVFTPPRGPRIFPKGELPLNSDDGVAGDVPAQPRNHMLIAGTALALSLACGGLWLSRRNGKGSVRGLTLLLAAGATLMAGAAVWADIRPPTRPPVKERPARKIENYPIALEGKANVEFVYGGEPVRLILDKASYEKMKKGELAMPSATPK